MRALRLLAIAVAIVLVATCDRPDDIVGPGSTVDPDFAKGATECSIPPAAAQQLSDLAAAVAALVADGTLSEGNGNALDSKLAAAGNQIGKCQAKPAANQLEAFINQVDAFVRSGGLSSAQGAPLIQAARGTIAVLDGTAPPPPPEFPDLAVSAIRVPAGVPVAEALAAEADIGNTGAADAGDATARFRVLDAASGAELATQDVAQGAIAAGATATLSATFTVDAAWPDAVVVEVTADVGTAVEESDEANNAATSAEVVITREPDLNVGAIAVPDEASLDEPFDVTTTVANIGLTGAPATDVRFRVLNPTDDSEVASATVALAALVAGDHADVVASFTPDAAWPDAVSIEATVDPAGAVAESDETNNTTTSTPVAIVRHADLTVTAVTGPDPTPIHEPFTATATVRNAGQADAPATDVRFRVLDVADDSEIATATEALAALTAGGEADIDASFTPDETWPDAVAIEATVDPAGTVEESDEDNNSSRSTPLNIVAPDLVIASVTTSSPSVLYQCTLGVGLTVENVGNATAAATQLRVSLQDAGTGSEFAGTTADQPALAPGETFTFAADFAAADGWSSDVVVRSSTDVAATVPERDETNNDGEADANVRALIDPPAGFSKLWICGSSTSWAQAGNWRPLGAPIATDDVYVPAGSPFQPALSAPVTVNDLTIEDGASLTLSSRALTASGNVSSGLMTSPGTLFMTGGAVTLRGTVPRLEVKGQATLSGDTHVLEAAVLSRGGRLAIAGQHLGVDRSLAVSFDDGSTDGLIMTDPADDVDVELNFSLAGLNTAASTEGSFTAGTLRVGGDFTAFAQAGQSPRAFVPTGTVVHLDGAAEQRLAFANQSAFHDVFMENSSAAGVALSTDVRITGQLSMVGNAVLEDLQSVRLLRLLYYNHLPITGPGYGVKDSRVVGDVVMDRDAAFPNAGNLFVDRGARLTVNGHRLHVEGSLIAQFDDGRADGLVMTNAADEVDVERTFSLAGINTAASTEGSFTAGTLRVGGDFSAFAQAGQSPRAFVPTGTVVHLDGAAQQRLAFANQSAFHDVFMENSSDAGVTLSTDVHVTGQLSMVGNAVLTNQGAGGHDVFYHSRMPIITGPGYGIDDTRIAGNVVQDHDVTLEHPANRLVVERGGRLTMAGHRLEVANQITVQLYTPGVEGIVMAHAADELIANGDFLYVGFGGSSAGDLTAGTIRVRRKFTHTHHLGSREVFVATGTTVVFDGDGTAQLFNGHTPQKIGGDGDLIPGTRFSDLVIAPGALVDFGISTAVNSSEMWVDGTADWHGRIHRPDSNLARWVVVKGDLILRAGFRGLSNAPICYVTLVDEGGTIGHNTTREAWSPLQQLGGGDCRKP